VSNSAVLVFTERSLKQILEEGGSQAWVLNRVRARQCKYLVCTQNNNKWGDEAKRHGEAFLVGRICAVVRAPDDRVRLSDDQVRSPDNKERSLIRIDEYAEIKIPNVWQGWRNPVRYVEDLEELGINLATLVFKPAPKVPETSVEQTARLPASPSPAGVVRPLTILEAKKGLAAHHGVSLDKIEIVIRY